MLNVYKASAGAGKTHRLAGEYLKLLFKHDNAFRHILAVTFTNKATDEMKSRILSELHVLSESPEKSGYLPELSQLFCDQDPAFFRSFVKKRAGELLIEILHDYSAFSISTIDRFFQLVARSFSREIGKLSNYRVELDSDMVIGAAVDELYGSLDNDTSSVLLKWLLKFSIDSVEDGKPWNIRKSLLETGRQLFTEEYKTALREGMKIGYDISQVESYRLKIVALKDDFAERLSSVAKEFMSEMERLGADFDMFKGKSRSPLAKMKAYADGNILPMPERLRAMADSPEEWFPSGKKAMSSDSCFEVLNGVLSKFVDCYDAGYVNFRTACVILQNIYSIGLLADLSGHIDDYTSRNGIMLLPQTTELLNDVIGEDDAPFIYEKTGVWIKSFMLDEFQDTSLMQWKNFRPLLSNSLAEGNDSLIVGDIKQSIYRWRGSDWRVMGEKIEEDLADYQINVLDVLKDNWRSLPNLVFFNNDFFRHAGYCAAALYSEKCGNENRARAAKMSGIYSGFEQNVPASRMEKFSVNDGYVEINVVSPASQSTWKEAAVSRLHDKISWIIGNGYSLEDIAVLVRTRSEGEMVAASLVENGYDVISDDSLGISSSMAVKRTVACLKHLVNPEDKINAFIAKGMRPVCENLPLYELCESIISDELGKYDEMHRTGQLPFVQAFMDSVLDYVSNEGSNIPSFLKWWDSSGSKKKLSAPENQHAVRVMTIHKSKGLGFKVCIIPFLDDGLEGETLKTIWRRPSCSPFDEIGVVPLPVTSALKDTIFADDYYHELMLNMVDCLNLSYVAFTRAKNSLVVFIPERKMKKSGEPAAASRISDLLYDYAVSRSSGGSDAGPASGPVLFECTDDGGMKSFKSGILPAAEKEEECADSGMMVVSYGTVPIGDRLRLSIRRTGQPEGDDVRRKGTVLHSILQNVVSSDDVEQAVEDAVVSGDVSVREKDGIVAKLKDAIASVSGRRWFDSAEDEIINERSIISKDGKLKRPDRMVLRADGSLEIIDYKFSRRNNSYVKQVEEYMLLMRESGYGQVRGYVWYVEESFVQEVDIRQ